MEKASFFFIIAMMCDSNVSFSSVSVLEHRQIADGYFFMSFEYPSFFSRPRPGQFFTLRAGDSVVPLLRRPFAFSFFSNDKAGFIYQKRGRATSNLAAMSAGEQIDIIAPLGNCFPMPSSVEYPVLLAGGVGLGPVLFFSSELERQGISHTLIIGARNSSFIPEYKPSSLVSFFVCTDDGSAGFKGNVADLLLENMPPAGAILYACGPNPMMKALHSIALDKGFMLWVSMEQVMACGVGACAGCVVPARGSYVRVCKDGPIFDSREIEWTSV
ncbi:dihydroorotate dehydrogenase electron transfer subunit [Spirochaetia bacterium 38H-sp]|uniref:Dihydroorotate dehydrogenase electron transfer subunit n=1 Tax=Rarispira pelagica TaxID=3141764 RepID=A0ABU9U9L2_9SPIR